MSQTTTRVVVYSSNVADKNKGYDILIECLRKKTMAFEEYIIPLVVV
jgi:hypothetical protein